MKIKHQLIIGLLTLLCSSQLTFAANSTVNSVSVKELAVPAKAAPMANSNYLDLGTLDVKVMTENGLDDWMINYAERGKTVIQYVQIANFSAKEKIVELYTTDSTTTDLGNNFMVKNQEELKISPEKITPWMSLPTQYLSLKSGETKLVPVTFKIPANAGIGLHTGAIIAREQYEANSNKFHVEKGVRVYLNIKGGVIDGNHLQLLSMQENANTVTMNFRAQNLGSIDFDNALKLELTSNGELLDSKAQEIYVRPGQAQMYQLSYPKPSFGAYEINLTSQKPIAGTATIMSYQIVAIPWWAVVAALLAIGAITLVTKSVKAPAINLAPLKSTFKTLNFSGLTFKKLQPSFSFVAVFMVMATIIVPFAQTTQQNGLMADVLQNNAQKTYIMTLKWGNFRKLQVPKTYKQRWNGEFRFENANVVVTQRLNFETNDAVNVINDGTTLSYNLTTDNTNDGIIVLVTPTKDQTPTVTYEDFTSKTNVNLDLEKMLSGQLVLPNKLHATWIKVLPGDIIQGSGNGLHGSSNGATPELNATSENQGTPEITINIPELKAIFNDIPATPELLSEYILSSDYVKKISTENSSTKIESDSVLIKALEATPEILEEIAATPNLNFTFIPSQTVNFPPTQFSFEKENTSTKDLGTMIFVQNRENPWNTYVSTTNLTSLSGKNFIPASSVTVNPGDAKILTENDGTVIEEGTQNNLKSTADKTILVNVKPSATVSEDETTIFSMNPKLSIKIPRKTPPGIYRGTLTITSL